MPSTPKPGPGNTWPTAPENHPVSPDDDSRTEAVAGPPVGPTPYGYAPAQNGPNGNGQHPDPGRHPEQVGDHGRPPRPGPPGAWPVHQSSHLPGPPNVPGPPPPGRSGWQLPEVRRKSPEELKATAVRTREQLTLFLVMVIGMLVVSQLILPFRLAGIVLGLGAGFVGVKVLIGLSELRRAGMTARGAVFTVFGLGLSGMLLLVLVTQAVYYPVVSDLEECQRRANSPSNLDLCMDQTNQRLENIVKNLHQPTRN